MKELSYEDWQKNPTPRMMWVWDENEMYKAKRKVAYVLRGNYKRVIAIDNTGYDYELYNHCVEIGEQRRMTNKELSWWLSEKPHRELKMGTYIYHDYDYKENEQDAEVTDLLLIREDDGEWREPRVYDELDVARNRKYEEGFKDGAEFGYNKAKANDEQRTSTLAERKAYKRI